MDGTQIALRRDVIEGDCLDVLAREPENAFDCCVTDPPYGLGFMGKQWDHGVPGVAFWREHLRVLKPGAHLLAFGGTRTFHRLTVAIEDAGFEIRDCIMWVYGSGFPKSLDVGKAIDKAAGATREVVGVKTYADGTVAPNGDNRHDGYVRPFMEDPDWQGTKITAPATALAKRWDGWGTALKPAWEPIVVARKPLVGTVAANVEKYGTGAINVDACRVPADDNSTKDGRCAGDRSRENYRTGTSGKPIASDVGRHPANLIHDGSADVVDRFAEFGDRGGISGGNASRFFYCAKASKADRGEGNDHPTVKPNALMRYLCRLVCPPGGVVLDAFCGSGSTLVAAAQEGFGFVGVEVDPHSAAIARRRAFGG
jgi:site-specific DNA-methyltransferase (adenine-specific)